MARGANRRKLLEKQPNCCFCGGKAKATTIEHAPPKVFFRNKQRPAGLEFPACRRCNNGSSQQDQVASYFSVTSGLVEESKETANKLLQGIANNTPDVLKLLSHRSEERMIVRGESQNMVIANIHPNLRRKWINLWVAKQAFALWYHHTGEIIDQNGLVSVNWITNHALMQRGLPEELLNLAVSEGSLEQGKIQVSDQYFYRFQVSKEEDIGIFMIGAHDASIYVATKFNARHKDLSSKRFLKYGDLYRTNSVKGIHAVPIHALSKIKENAAGFIP
ncbi:hypothetical protein [Thalassorhabdomicrobium marinisediminis]|uniref:hypothetical protein n=1 Tax=Thalassorhabdomicrobium marinisediminis TaxID=2170577 RepID=UPI0024929070|nr:hypothetical protein [Thalassorhabdomicrobium marinisediminis]